MTRISVRCLVLILIASLCFAVFTLGASAADSTPSVTATFKTQARPGGPSSSVTLNLGQTYDTSRYSCLTGLSVSFSEPGSLAITIYGAGGSTVSGSGVSYTVSGSALIVSVVASQAGDVPITVSEGSVQNATPQVGLNSWIPDSGGGGSGGGETPADPEWTLGNNFGDWRPGLAVPNQTSTSTQWKTYNEYIGEYVTTVTTTGDSKSFSGPADSFFVSALAALTYDDWSWGVGEDGKMYFSPPAFAEGSWLDNIWRMDVYLYYNLANQTGWFGGVNDRLDTLNARVLQILSVLANDEDVKIKDATTEQRTWIQNYFEGEHGGATSDNFTALNDSFNEVTGQFQSDFSISDIGQIFASTSYDNQLWYFFWSSSVSNDVNGVSRGGFSGGKAPARAPAASQPSWSSQYSYDNDDIVDMSGFGGDTGG